MLNRNEVAPYQASQIEDKAGTSLFCDVIVHKTEVGQFENLHIAPKANHQKQNGRHYPQADLAFGVIRMSQQVSKKLTYLIGYLI